MPFYPFRLQVMEQTLLDQSKLFPATLMPDADWWQALWPAPLEVLEKIGFRPGMTAIDLCCGDGMFTLPMSVLLGGKVTAVDLDPKMLQLAKNALENAGAPACRWMEGDARDMERLIDEKVDIVLIANTFHGVPGQTELARSAAGMLKSGGLFVVLNWHARPRDETVVLDQPRGPRTELRMSVADVRKVVEPAGLSFEAVVELPPYHYAALFRKPS